MNKMFQKNALWFCMFAALGVTACSKTSSDSSSTYSAEKPSSLMGGISGAIVAVGDGMTSPGASSLGHQKVQTMMAASDCTAHGDPDGINQGNAAYPGTLAYCKLKINDGSPDTVQGGFALAKAISCALEHAGLTWDGAAHSVTITPSATCFSAEQLTDMGTSSMSVTVTASKPASFNTYFDAGIELVVSGFGTFKIASKMASNKIEFGTMEDQGTDKQGSTYGSLDLSTGVLRYEARMVRINCAESGSCGWNRHIRMAAVLSMTGTTPADLDSVSFAYSNIQGPPGQSGYGGVLVTATGDMTNGIKPRLWQATDGSGGSAANLTDIQTIAKWTETANNKCYTSGSETATTCGAGLDKFTTNVDFLLTGGTFSSVNTWFTSFAGATYSAVDANEDSQ